MCSFLKKTAWLACAAMVIGCGGGESGERLSFAASIEPAAMIVRAIAGDRADVHVLLPAGTSPHHYEPSPSDARAAERARATFYFDPTVDAWAARLGGDRAVPLFDAEVNEDGHAHENPHVWLDPIAVRDRLPHVVEVLSKLDPAGADMYRTNAQAFADRLTELNREIAELLRAADGLAIIEAHASWDRFLERYGIRVAGVMEPTPGASLTPREFAELTTAVSNGEVAAIIAEPQLPRGPLETLADGKARIVELDPLGGRGEMTTYEALIRINATRLAEAIR